jgi:phage tail-like protein
VREQLVQSAPGRFLRLRLRLGGDGNATPSLWSVRLLHPRNSYRNDLPAVWSKDAGPRAFLDGFLSLFERALTRIEHDRDDFYRLLRPAAAPPDVLRWLAALLDLTFDPSWPLARRRALVGEAVDLYRRRGTPAGIVRYVEVYAGIRPVVTEQFRLRPDRATTAGGGVLGSSFAVGLAGATDAPPDEELIRAYAHRFTVHLPLPDPCDRDVVVGVVDRIVTVNKPAHTAHELAILGADARVGEQSTVGVDLIPGARPVAGTRLDAGGDAPVLGRDTVLGPRRPYPRPPDNAL